MDPIAWKSRFCGKKTPGNLPLELRNVCLLNRERKETEKSRSS